MAVTDCNDSNSLMPVQKHAEKIFVAYIHRLQPLVKDQQLALIDAIRVAREMVQDTRLLTKIAEDEHCVHSAELGQTLDIRTQHFKRFVLHQFMHANHLNHHTTNSDEKRFWLLHLIDIIEIALGQFRFQEAQAQCDHLVHEQRQQGQVNFHQFLSNELIMVHYVTLMFHLAIFLEAKPKHRIGWLLHSLESNPTSRVEFGLEIHVNNDMHPPTQTQSIELLVNIFDSVIQYIHQHMLTDVLKNKFPQLAIEPNELLKQLMLNFESGVGRDN